jgi:hypothetical protein
VLLLAMDVGNNSSALHINDWRLRDVCPATGPDGQLTMWVKGRKTLQKRQDAQAFIGVFTTRLMLGPGDRNWQILTTVYDLVKDGLVSWLQGAGESAMPCGTGVGHNCQSHTVRLYSVQPCKHNC